MRGLFFIGFALLLLVAGGCSRKVTSATTSSDTKDSVHVELKPRLIDIKLPGEKTFVVGKISLDSTGSFIPLRLRDKGNLAFVDVVVKSDGTIIATGGCDSLKTVVEAMDKEIFRLKHTKLKDTRTITVTQYKAYGFDIFCRWYFGITLFLAGLFVYLKFKKLIL